MLTPPKRRWHKIQTIDDHGEIPLTPEAHARMKARLARLKASLPALIDDAAEAASYGDRSDNSAYKESKGLLRRAKGQILMLEDQLKRITIIKDSTNASGVIALGSHVVLTREGSPNTVTYRIVGPFEADPVKGFISYKSPLGAALIGKKSGDEVTIKTPVSEKTFQIKEVK